MLDLLQMMITGRNKISCCHCIHAELQLEECPKWLAVTDVLSEIEAEIKNNPQISANDYSSTCSIMIAAQDDRACSQIRDVRLKFFLINCAKHLILF